MLVEVVVGTAHQTMVFNSLLGRKHSYHSPLSYVLLISIWTLWRSNNTMHSGARGAIRIFTKTKKNKKNVILHYKKNQRNVQKYPKQYIYIYRLVVVVVVSFCFDESRGVSWALQRTKDKNRRKLLYIILKTMKCAQFC